MASTRGFKPLPLPNSLIDGMRALGFVELAHPDPGPRTFALPRHPGLRTQMVTTNMPGESAVIASIGGGRTERLDPDTLLARLAEAIAILDTPNGRRT